MQYLLMCCIDETHWTKLPDSQRRKIMDDYGKLIQELKKHGRLLAGAQLDKSSSAVTVRERNGKPVVLDGPFAETKEQLGGYHLVECKDRDDEEDGLTRVRLTHSGFINEQARALSRLAMASDATANVRGG